MTDIIGKNVSICKQSFVINSEHLSEFRLMLCGLQNLHSIVSTHSSINKSIARKAKISSSDSTHHMSYEYVFATCPFFCWLCKPLLKTAKSNVYFNVHPRLIIGRNFNKFFLFPIFWATGSFFLLQWRLINHCRLNRIRPLNVSVNPFFFSLMNYKNSNFECFFINNLSLNCSL